MSGPSVTPMRRVRVAAGLWLLLTVVWWMVIYDRLVVLAGRRYSHDATVAFRESHRYLTIAEGLTPLVRQAARTATTMTVPVLLVGWAAVWWAGRSARRAQVLLDERQRR